MDMMLDMNKTYHLALTTEPEGEILVHRADCPDVHKAAEDGYEIHSLFGCREPIMPGLRQHSCLEQWGPDELNELNNMQDASQQGISKIKRFKMVKRLQAFETSKKIPIEDLCEGVVFADGKVAVRWFKSNEIDIWPSLEQWFGTMRGSEFGEDMFWDDI
jgi:hypothetical protein